MMCNLCEKAQAENEFYLSDETKIFVCSFCFGIIQDMPNKREHINRYTELAFLREYVATVKNMQFAKQKVLKREGKSFL